jgi:hypothetical protein
VAAGLASDCADAVAASIAMGNQRRSDM